MANSVEAREHYLVGLYVVGCEIHLKTGKKMESFSLFEMVYLHFTSVHFRLFSLLQLINETRIVIVPSINPDGLEVAVEKQCTSLQGMTNAHGKDLDTDFFGQWWLRLIFFLVKSASVLTCRFSPFR